MNADDIDRALRHDPPITPSRRLAFRVMRSVRREAARRQALPFPWRPLAAGLALGAGLTAAGLVAAVIVGAPSAATADALAEVVAQIAPAVAWLSATLLGSFGLTWWSLRPA